MKGRKNCFFIKSTKERKLKDNDEVIEWVHSSIVSR